MHILGDGFLGHYYIVVYKASDFLSPFLFRYYVLIENIKKPIIVELKRASHVDNYVVFMKKNLRDNIPVDLYNSFVERGLCSNIENGRKEADLRVGIYRVVLCLYQNILGQDIHHIYKDIELNDITNIVPLEVSPHKRIDKIEIEKGIAESLAIQKEQKCKIFKEKQTLANNKEIILELLKMKLQQISPKDIALKMKNKIGRSKVYEHLRFFFYNEIFSKWLENKTEQELSELNGFLPKRWALALRFEDIETNLEANKDNNSEALLEFEKFAALLREIAAS